jgi:hypothetical protein
MSAAEIRMAKRREQAAMFEAEKFYKRRERDLFPNDAELARLLSLTHNQLNLDLTMIEQAQVPDNWRGVANLAPRVIALWTRLADRAAEVAK